MSSTVAADRPPIDPYPLSPMSHGRAIAIATPILHVFKEIFPQSGNFSNWRAARATT